MNQRSFFYIFCHLLLFCGHVATAQEVVTGQCDIQFFAKATWHNFSGKVTSEPFSISLSKGENQDDLIFDWEVEVLVRNIDTSNARRDKDMYRMFDATTYPKIRGSFHQMDYIRGKEMPFVLTIRDISRNKTIKITSWKETDQQITFYGEFHVSLNQFNLKPPSGFLIGSVKDDIFVKCKCFLIK